MGNTRNTGYLQNTIKVSDTGAITFVSGSTTLLSVNTTGQLSGSAPVLSAATASFVALAQSASNAVSAQTASFANALTVAGTLTAQTLVVQTITSSVDFVTGSTRFGSLAANTHQFTGSMLVSGSVGIGVSSPNSTLQVRGNNGTTTAAVLRLRDTNTTARTTRLQFEDYTGALADGVVDFRIGTAGDASTATLSIGINSAGLTFNNTNAATFASSITTNSTVRNNLLNGTILIRDNGTEQVEVNIRHSSSKNGVVTFTEEGVSDRWAIGTKPSDGSLYFASGYNLSTPRLTIASAGAATFASSVTATSLSISSTSNATNPANGSIVSAGGLGLGGDIYLHPFNANQSNYGYIKTSATTVNTLTLTIGTTYGFGTGVDAVSFYNGAATFAGSITTPSNISANNIRTFSLTMTGSPVSTGLGINAGSGGRTYLILTSQQWDAGSSTSSRVWMIWCGYDGNNFSATLISSAGGSSTETWSQSGGILYVAGSTNFQMDLTVISNG